MDYSLKNLNTIVRSLGRGVVMYATSDEAGTVPARWGPGSPLYLNHLGDTEGDIQIQTNAGMSPLTLPELTGGAAHEMDYEGENPVITMPLFLTDPALEAIVSPIGLASAGRSRRSSPAEHTLVIFPEGLYLDVVAGETPEQGTLTFDGGAWEFNGAALSVAKQALLAVSFWAWRGVFTRPAKTFHGGAGDARKNIEPTTFTVMHHPDMPEGHHLYTIGDPADVDIDIEGGS